MTSAPRLNLFDATMIVMGGVVGVGIFFNPHAVAEALPHPGLFLAAWVLGGLIVINGALTFAELGASLPHAGGWYVFLREAFGPFVAFLFAWVVLCAISSGAISVMMSIAVTSLHGLVPGIGPSGSGSSQVAGAILLAAITGLSMLGVKAGATFQNACMLIKLAAIGAMAAGAWLVFDGPPPGAIAHAPIPDQLGSRMLQAMLPVLFSCGGWQLLCYIAPQVKDPQKTLPRAVILGVGGVVVVYLAINMAYLRVLGVDGLRADVGFANEMARRTLGGTGGEILRAAMGISALGVVTVTIIATPWLYVAMAKEGLFFKRFEHLHSRTGAPILALGVQLVLCLAYWFWARAGVVADSVVFVEWIFHALAALALLTLRKRRPDLPRPFKSPLYPMAPILYFLLAATLVIGTLWRADARQVGIGLSVIAVGAVVYRPWRWLVARA
ncbi:MAG: APC family permease [Planctomycetota bacterium]